MTTGLVRSGALTESALVDALASEGAAGASPSELRVSSDLEMVALRIVGRPASVLDAVRGIAPNVVVDGEMAPATWRLA